MVPIGATLRSTLASAGRLPNDYHKISQSLRFNDDDSAHLLRTNASGPTSSTRGVISLWYKRGNLGGTMTLFSNNPIASFGEKTYFDSNDNLVLDWNDDAGDMLWTSTQKFRDSGAWGHLVFVWDTTNATAADRVKVYHNGVEITAWTKTSNLALNATLNIAQAGATWKIGAGNTGGTAVDFFDGYMAKFVYLDIDSVLDATSFGEFDNNGVWRPIDVSGLTFGTNGFHLDFANSAQFGKDVSGNGNHFVASGLSISDKMLDSPTDDAANDVGNYCVMNNLCFGGCTLSNGGLRVSCPNDKGTVSTIAVKGGKWRFQATVVSQGNHDSVGIGSFPNDPDTDIGFSGGINGDVCFYHIDGNKIVGGAYVAYGTAYTVGDVIDVFFDADTGTIWFAKNGTLQNSATQSEVEAGTTTNAATTGLTFAASSGNVFAIITAGGTGTGVWDLNFGQSLYTHSYGSITSYKNIYTANFPTPTIKDPSKYFQAEIFTGTGAENAITLSGNSTFQPDLVWIKDRDTAVEHVLTDAVRGATLEINSNSTNIDSTVAQGLKSFDTAGFTVGTDSNYNASGSLNVAWVWDESATSGFDIVTYTGDGGASKTINHSLGAVPAMMIVKSRETAADNNWTVFHTSLGNTKAVFLNLTNTPVTSSGYWNNTSPTSTQFTVGSNENDNTIDWVAYLFAEVPGFSRFGSYTGNGSTDGPFVWCGFQPKFVIAKNASAVGSWILMDTSRSVYNSSTSALRADDTSAQETGFDTDLLSNGFKIRANTITLNGSGNTIIFAAFAENPFGGSGVSQARAR